MSKHAIGRLRTHRRIVNSATKYVVGLGGAAVIGAIALIFFYLLWVVVPLFQSATVDPMADLPHDAPTPLLLDIDENSEIGVEIGATAPSDFFRSSMVKR
ncbi:MAG: hypothetical protein HC809_15940 [Gammaproteobacteria bacterium]|nr:hypothetical protein [Gammaproteobacteria bacterium]